MQYCISIQLRVTLVLPALSSQLRSLALQRCTLLEHIDESASRTTHCGRERGRLESPWMLGFQRACRHTGRSSNPKGVAVAAPVTDTLLLRSCLCVDVQCAWSPLHRGRTAWAAGDRIVSRHGPTVASKLLHYNIIVLYCTVMYCTVLHVLYCTVQYYC